jgi:putative transposase
VKVLNELRQFYPLDELLKAAEIPRSTFYYHLKALSKPDKYADVKKRIGEIYHENKGRYGYRRVTLSLHRDGERINHKAVQRLMGTLSLKAAIKVKRYSSYRGEVGQTAPNVLKGISRLHGQTRSGLPTLLNLQSMGESCICLQ